MQECRIVSRTYVGIRLGLALRLFKKYRRSCGEHPGFSLPGIYSQELRNFARSPGRQDHTCWGLVLGFLGLMVIVRSVVHHSHVRWLGAVRQQARTRI